MARKTTGPVSFSSLSSGSPARDPGSGPGIRRCGLPTPKPAPHRVGAALVEDWPPRDAPRQGGRMAVRLAGASRKDRTPPPKLVSPGGSAVYRAVPPCLRPSRLSGDRRFRLPPSRRSDPGSVCQMPERYLRQNRPRPRRRPALSPDPADTEAGAGDFSPFSREPGGIAVIGVGEGVGHLSG